MELKNLKFNRFIGKDPKQDDSTEGAVYTGSNPAPKRGDQDKRKVGQAKDNQEDGGAPNILTGTVITACIIQTSALPSRIELEGNDLTFYDDTYLKDGEIVGDTSRLVFTHDLNSNEGFIMEKRASLINTYDNVLSWYATPAKQGYHNYMFIGRNGDSNDAQRNLSSIHFAVNYDPNFLDDANSILNGVFELEYSENGVQENVNWKPLLIGSSVGMFPGSGLTGFSTLTIAGEGGVAGLGYADSGSANIVVGLYITSTSQIALGMDLIPDTNGAYDIGSPAFKVGTFYGSVSACPLPTVENALEILERVPKPSFVGERGHYGLDRKYFDDLTFPKEVLYTDKKGRVDIEHNHMLGFLLKVVIELKAEVDALKANKQ